jgi:hypothetical protein
MKHKHKWKEQNMSTTETPPTPDTGQGSPAQPTPPVDNPAANAVNEAAPQVAADSDKVETDLKAEFNDVLSGVEKAVHTAQTLPQAKDAVTDAISKVQQWIAAHE